jgi:hypothetical protein
MAAIQPKNTNEIHVDIIDEKTGSAGISLKKTTKVDTLAEYTGGAAVMINSIVKFFTGAANKLVPQMTTVDLGTTTTTEHFRDGFFNNIKSYIGSAMSVGTYAAQSLQLVSNSIVRLTLLSTGRLNIRLGHTGYTSGGEIVEGTAALSTTSNTAQEIFRYTIGSTNTVAAIRFEITSRDSVGSTYGYKEYSVTGVRAGAGAAAGTVLQHHTMDTALISSVTLTVSSNDIIVNISPNSNNQMYHLCRFQIIPVSTST